MSDGQFKMTMDRDWEYQMFRTLECGALVAETTEKIRGLVVKDSPRNRGTKTNWNQIKKNMDSFVERDERGYYGNVTIELNERVRHTLLQDRGWTDRAGHRHPGKKFLKEALLKARVNE